MRVNESNYTKSASLLVCLLLALGGMLALFAVDLSAAEEEEPVAEETELNGESVILFDGVYYKVTTTDDDNPTVGVYSLADGTADVSIPCAVSVGEDDEAVTYTVTSLLEYAFKNASITSLELPVTLTCIEANAISSATSYPAFVLPGIEGDDGILIPNTEDVIAESDYLKDTALDSSKYKYIDVVTAIVITYNINLTDAIELKATNAGDFEDGQYSSAIYAEVVNCLVGNAFEREYFEMTGWAGSADGEVEYDDGTDVEYDDFSADTTIYAVWEEADKTAGYPEYYMWITTGIIIALAAIGISIIVIRRLQARA